MTKGGFTMGLINFVKNQFIEVIEWLDSTTDTIVYKFPDNNKEINMGAQLTVRESQSAIFVNEGQIADIFPPGMYTLTTNNLPVLTALKSWKYGFNSPFKSEIYFVNTKQFTDQKWGTANPIMMRDADFGMIRLRGFGVYSFRVSDPKALMLEIAGTNKIFKTEDIHEQIKKQLVSSLFDAIATSQIAALDLAMRYDEIGEQTAANLNQKLNKIGISMTSLVIENISLPEEVETALDKRTSMGALGNLNNYTQFQTAEAIGNMGKKEGGGNTAFDMGAGLAMSKMMMDALTKTTETPAVAPTSSPISTGKKLFCSNCGKELTLTAKFCSDCGNKV